MAEVCDDEDKCKQTVKLYRTEQVLCSRNDNNTYGSADDNSSLQLR